MIQRILFISLLAIVIVSSGVSAFAQANTTTNPFELKQRIKEKPIQADTAKHEAPTNPFDINRKGAIPVEEHPQVFNDPNLLKKGWKVGGFTFWIFAGLLTLLALIMPFGRHTVANFYRSLTGSGPFNILFRNYGTMRFPVGFGLYLFFLLNLGLFIFIVAKQFEWIENTEFREWFLITLAVAMLIIAKHLVLRFLGWVFPIGKDTIKYSFLIGVFNSITGLILFPVNWILVYGPETTRLPVIYGAIGLILLFNLYRYLIGTSSASQQVLRNKFNFFMYLCTLEIAPVLVIAKFVLFHKG